VKLANKEVTYIFLGRPGLSLFPPENTVSGKDLSYICQFLKTERAINRARPREITRQSIDLVTLAGVNTLLCDANEKTMFSQRTQEMHPHPAHVSREICARGFKFQSHPSLTGRSDRKLVIETLAPKAPCTEEKIQDTEHVLLLCLCLC
jgi:hypothetical protein